MARNGFGSTLISSTAAPVPDRPFDADRRALAEGDIDAEVGGQGRLDDLLLHLAVQRHGDLLAPFVLPQVDQRVLLGELVERDAQGPPVREPVRHHHGLQ